MRKYVLAAVLMLLCSSASVNCYAAKEWIQSGSFSYTVKDDGTAAIVGYNAEDEETVEIHETIEGHSVTSIEDNAFRDCKELTSVFIPDSVTSVGEYAFYGCENMTDITFPDTVTSIGQGAFYECGLTEVELPASLMSIEDHTFHSCRALTHVLMPEGLIRIGEGAFYECESLTDIELPDSVTSIGSQAFYDCCSLTDLDLPDSLTNIDFGAFQHCEGITEIEIPEGTVSIGDRAFSGCGNLRSVKIPASLTDMGSHIFEFCSNLESITVSPENNTFEVIDDVLFNNTEKKLKKYLAVKPEQEYTIPDGTLVIDDYAFEQARNLQKVYVPDTVISMGEYDKAFDSCGAENFTLVVEPGSYAAQFAAERGIAYVYPDEGSQDGEADWLTGSEAAEESELAVVEASAVEPAAEDSAGSDMADEDSTGSDIVDEDTAGTESAAGDALDWLTDGEDIAGSDPASFKEPDEEKETTQESETAEEIEALPYVCRPNGDGTLTLTGMRELHLGTVLVYEIPDEIEGMKITDIEPGLFSENFWITDFSVSPDSEYFEAVDGVLFSKKEKSLVAYPAAKESSEYVVPEGTLSIEPYAFSKCGNLGSIVIPASVTDIAEGAFVSCCKLSGIYVSPDSENYAVLDNVLFNKKEKSLICYPCMLPEKSYTIPQGILSIGDAAFSGSWSEYPNLEEVKIPDSVSRIGDRAFYWCQYLSDLVIPSSVKEIGDECFYGCRLLQTIDIPASVESIGKGAFSNCEWLNSVKVSPENSSYRDIESVLFSYEGNELLCYPPKKEGEEYSIPEGVEVLGPSAFDSCTYLVEIILPASLTDIGEKTFNNCLGIREMKVPQAVSSIGRGAFNGCNNLTLLVAENSYPEQYAVENYLNYRYYEAEEVEPSGEYAENNVFQEAVAEVKRAEEGAALPAEENPADSIYSAGTTDMVEAEETADTAVPADSPLPAPADSSSPASASSESDGSSAFGAMLDSLLSGIGTAVTSGSDAVSVPEMETETVMDEYLFPDIAERYLTQEDIGAMTAQQVCYAKNEPYARHGRKFMSVELQQYFGSKSWYQGTIEPNLFSDSVFTSIELTNIQLLADREEALCPGGYQLDQPGYDISLAGTASLRQ